MNSPLAERRRSSVVIALAVLSAIAIDAYPASSSSAPTVTRLVMGLAGGAGSTIGPDGALYVAEPAAGRISRVNPKTGDITTFASGLPPAIVGIGGPMDVAFIGEAAYVLVTLVGPDIGGADVVGIYRVDGPSSSSVLADIGAFAVSHPPSTAFDVPTGLQYALDVYRGSFLVTDGHHNRVLQVALDGTVSELIAFDNIVPTGLALSGSTVYMAQAGPVPHLPEDGKVVTFRPKSPVAAELASGASLLVDVEFGHGHRLFALSQGDFSGGPAGSPALPDTGALCRVNHDGTLDVVVDRLNQPTSVEFVKKTAYIVTLGGEIWKIEGI